MDGHTEPLVAETCQPTAIVKHDQGRGYPSYLTHIATPQHAPRAGHPARYSPGLWTGLTFNEVIITGPLNQTREPANI